MTQAQAQTLPQPKFPLGSLVLYGDACVRVIGIERFVPSTMWFYLLGAKVGEHKMTWHSTVPEIEIEWPEMDNVVDMTRRRK